MDDRQGRNDRSGRQNKEIKMRFNFIKQAMQFLIIGILVLSFPGFSYVTTFDDLSSTTKFVDINSPYNGFEWKGFYVLHKDHDMGEGLHNGTVSGDYAVYTGYEYVSTITSVGHADFNFSGAYLTAAWQDTVEITINGYLEDELGIFKLKYSDTVTLIKEAPAWYDLNYSGIDRISFYLVKGSKFILDDFNYDMIEKSYESDRLAVRAILDSNYLEDVSVKEVSKTWKNDAGSGRIRELNLPGQSLFILPPEIGVLDTLEVLNLTKNSLKSLPKEIGKLTNLKKLWIDDNEISDLPPEIGNISSLLNLYISRNNLSELPKALFNCRSLKYFRASSNNISLIPKEIKNLKSLNRLIIDKNKIKSLPVEIGFLSRLDTFFANNNAIDSIPEEIGKLTKLSIMNLSNNNIKSLPGEINGLSSLRYFYIKKNEISSLPSEIGELVKLTDFDISHNKLETLPKEIETLAGIRTLKLNNNELKNLPAEIRNIAPFEAMTIAPNFPSVKASDKGLSISFNKLCSLDQEITSWINKHSVDEDWPAKQTCE